MISSARDISVPTTRTLTFAQTLMLRAESLALAWRRDHCGDRDPLDSPAQLDGLVESLVSELGRSLSNPGDLPAAPWGRVAGVFRLSTRQGADGLCWEFSVLRTLLGEAAVEAEATPAELRRLQVFLDAIQTQALALLEHRTQAGVPRPAVAFGGVVVEAA